MIGRGARRTGGTRNIPSTPAPARSEPSALGGVTVDPAMLVAGLQQLLASLPLVMPGFTNAASAVSTSLPVSTSDDTSSTAFSFTQQPTPAPQTSSIAMQSLVSPTRATTSARATSTGARRNSANTRPGDRLTVDYFAAPYDRFHGNNSRPRASRDLPSVQDRLSALERTIVTHGHQIDYLNREYRGYSVILENLDSEAH